MSDEKEKSKNSQETGKLYRTFAAIQDLAVKYVAEGADTDEKLARVREVNSALMQSMNGIKLQKMLSNEDRCWDPILLEWVDC